MVLVCCVWVCSILHPSTGMGGALRNRGPSTLVITLFHYYGGNRICKTLLSISLFCNQNTTGFFQQNSKCSHFDGRRWWSISRRGAEDSVDQAIHENQAGAIITEWKSNTVFAKVIFMSFFPGLFLRHFQTKCSPWSPSPRSLSWVIFFLVTSATTGL